MIRRLCVEHRLFRLVTLTFKVRTDLSQRSEVVRHVGLFWRRLRRRIPGLRYLWVLEIHPGGHGWHVHAVVDRWLDKGTLAEVWGHGFVDVRRVKVHQDGASPAESARRAAHYVAKYVAKTAAEVRELGSHRYERAQGMPLTIVLAEGPLAQMIALVAGTFVVTWSWFSGKAEAWHGPPCYVFRGG